MTWRGRGRLARRATPVAEPTRSPSGEGVAGARLADGARLVVQTWVGTRLLLILVALWVARTTGRSSADMLANWDVQHFFRIAEEGYVHDNDIAFFPGWPLLLRWFGWVGVPPLVAGIVLAAVCSGLAAAALLRLGGPVAAISWLLVPTAVFTFVPYTESLFCAAAFWAWERARAGRWGAAAALASVACTVRVSGLFLVIALAVLALWPGGSLPAGPGVVRSRSARPAAGRWRALAWLLLPAATLAGYALSLYLTTGDWLAWYTAQTTGWARGFTWPWTSLLHTWEAANSTAYPAFPEWAWVFRAELVSMGVGVLVTAACLVRRRWGEATWVGLQVVAFSFSYWFFSVNRAVLLWFPLFLLIADVAGGGRGSRAVRVGVVAAAVVGSLLVMAGWAWLFYTGRWAS